MTKVPEKTEYKPLTPKEAKFCYHFTHDEFWRPTRAARAAGYKDSPYLPSLATGMLKKPHIQEAIRVHLRGALPALGADPARVIRELCEIAYLDVADLVTVNRDTNRVTITDRMGKLGHLIKSVKQRYDREGNVIGCEFAVWNKLEALRLLVEVMRMMKDDGVDKGPSIVIVSHIPRPATEPPKGEATPLDHKEADDETT